MTRGKTKQYLHLKEEWIQLYNDGATYTEIAKKYNVQIETVSRYIKHHVNKKSKSPYRNEVRTWLSYYKKGLSFADIAREFNVSETAVKNNIYKEIDPVIQELKWTWVALYKKGKSLNSIGHTYHFHPKVILNVIKDEVNLTNKNSRNIYEPFIDEWKQLYREGLSVELIAEKYHVSSSTVYRNIKGEVMMRSKKTDKEMIKKLVPVWRAMYYKEGYTLEQIGNQFNISISTIFRHVKNP